MVSILNCIFCFVWRVILACHCSQQCTLYVCVPVSIMSIMSIIRRSCETLC